MRVNLKTDSAQWVEIKDRWSFGDKLAITEGGFAAMDCLLTGQSLYPPRKLVEFDDIDGQVIVEAIKAARQAQLGRLNDPSLLDELIADLAGNEIRREYAGLVTRARLCLGLRCLPDDLDRQDDARIKEIVVLLNAQEQRTARDADQAALQGQIPPGAS